MPRSRCSPASLPLRCPRSAPRPSRLPPAAPPFPRSQYPFAGKVATKADFPSALKSHLEGSATTNFTKLEGFCKGPFMCGAVPQSGDFHVFEMLDQHSNDHPERFDPTAIPAREPAPAATEAHSHSWLSRAERAWSARGGHSPTSDV